MLKLQNLFNQKATTWADVFTRVKSLNVNERASLRTSASLLGHNLSRIIHDVDFQFGIDNPTESEVFDLAMKAISKYSAHHLDTHGSQLYIRPDKHEQQAFNSNGVIENKQLNLITKFALQSAIDEVDGRDSDAIFAIAQIYWDNLQTASHHYEYVAQTQLAHQEPQIELPETNPIAIRVQFNADKTEDGVPDWRNTVTAKADLAEQLADTDINPLVRFDNLIDENMIADMTLVFDSGAEYQDWLDWTDSTIYDGQFVDASKLNMKQFSRVDDFK